MIFYLSGSLKHFKLFDRNLLIFWCILTALIVLFNRNLENAFLQVILHIVLIGILLVFIPWLDRRTENYWVFIRNWYLILALPLLYYDVGSFLHLVTPNEFDPILIAVEKHFFGIIPNLWIQALVNPYLTEFMQISYSIYWITIPLGAAVFYYYKRLDLFEYLLYYVTIAFFLSYLIFIFFPVAGPRFFLADQLTVKYEGLFIADYLRDFMKQSGYRGGAFPSSHVGVAVTILTFLWHFQSRVAKKMFLPLVIALSLATVYGQYHYVVDVIAGLTMGLCIGFWGARKTRAKLSPALLH
ncbi:MAG: phosphatase PAP2 family protein [bacterium]|nr:MAG: phosphatase PAP2 family protein [bacterium]